MFGDADDVRRLLGRMNLADFGYREVAHRQALRDASADWPAYDTGAAVRRASDAPFLCVALVSEARGAGRTTLAAQLVRAVAEEGRGAVAVELDPANALASWFENETSPRSVADLISAESIAARAPIRSARRASCVPFGACSGDALSELEQTVRADPARFDRGLRSLATGAEVVVLDVVAGDSPWLELAVRIAHRTLAVVTPGPTLAQEVALLEQLAARHETTFEYLANRFDGRHLECRRSLAALRGALGPRVLPVVVHEDRALLATGTSQPAPDAPRSQAAADVRALASCLRAGARGESTRSN